MSTEPTSWFKDQKGDCAVVLTGGPSRVREGFDLLTQGRVRKLIISGVFPGAELREIFPEWPFYGPISEEDVVLEKRSGTTFGNARQSLPLVEALKCRNVILVTSRLHMYRSERIFRSVFPPEIHIEPRAIIAGKYRPSWLDLGMETLKSLFYSIWAY
jgi:uncharacterized SAM-binding protein YcdF (DUF218 family)